MGSRHSPSVASDIWLEKRADLQAITRRCLQWLSLAGAAITFIPLMMVSQIPTGSIAGTVTDRQGLVVSGAQVRITNQDTGARYDTVTSSLGAYQLLRLVPGVYRVEINKSGFRTSAVTDVKVDAGTEYSVAPINLDVGSKTEVIEVSAGEELVQTTSAQVTATVEKRQLDELPLQDRNPLAVTLLQAGVSGFMQSDLTSFPPSNTAINGQRTSFTNMTLDGINIQDNFIRENAVDFTPNNFLLGQVAEVTITNQNGGPDTGLGSSQVNFITPAGTNKWHGEVFWFHRNSFLAANDWFNNHEGIPRPHFLLNQVGGNIGGPILRKRLFVYGAYELYDNPSHTPGSGTILLPGAVQGLFSYHTDCGMPKTAPCPAGVTNGQIVKTNLFSLRCASASYLCSSDPAIASQMAQLPGPANDPTQGDGLNTSGFKLNRRNNSRLDNASTRFDYIASQHHSFAATFAWNRAFFDRPDVDGSFDLVPNVFNRDTIKFLSTSWRWSPRATFTNEARFGFDLAPGFFKGGVNVHVQPYVLAGTIYSNPSPTAFYQGRDTNTYSWQDNASWTHRNHTINFGGLIQHIYTGTVDANAVIPTYGLGFSSFDSNKPTERDFSCAVCSGDISSGDLGSASALLATLAGNIGSVSQQFNVSSRTSGYVSSAPQIGDYTLNDYSLYAADSWKLRRQLTLSLGLRWEYMGRYNELHGLLLEPVIQSGQSVQQTLLGDANVDFVGGSSGRQVYAKDLDNFAPQIGISWDPWGNGKTAVRAGFSLHYVNDETIRASMNSTTQMPGINTFLSDGNLVGNTVTGNPPPAITPPMPQIPYTLQDQWLQSCAGPANTPPDTFTCNGIMAAPPNLGFMDHPNLQTPYVQDWNVSIQRSIGWDTSLTVSYLGNRANRLYKGIDYNQVDIRNNGILGDFLRARSNGFLSLAATGTFDPRYDSGIPGSQPLTVFSQLDGQPQFGDGGFLACCLASLVQTGEVGDLVNLEHVNYVNYANGQAFPWAPNLLIIPGDMLANAGYSDWNAGTIELRRRSRRGLYLQANYSFSKAITNGDGVGQARFDPFLDNAQPWLDKRRAAIDLTHAFKTNFLYEVPIGRGHSLRPRNPVLDQLASGWSVGTIMVWQSGMPYSILSGRATLNRGSRAGGRNTADTTLSASQISHSLGVFDKNGTLYAIDPKFIGPDGRAAPADALTCTPLISGGFCNPGPGTVGNLARDAFSGPAYYDWDLSISKKTSITEAQSLEFQGAFFNFLNHPTFLVGDQNINSTKFGVIGSTATIYRRIQFGLRLTF